jgi:metal-responsive CopG/Arc/MetJ family transcriptional regulator
MNQKWGIVVSTRIPDRLAKKMDDYIKKEDVLTSRSDVIRLALKLFFENTGTRKQARRYTATAQILNPATFPGVKR